MQDKIDWRQKWIGVYLGGRPSTSIRDSQYRGLNRKWEKRGKDSFDSYDYFGPTLRQGGSHGFLLLGREEREIFVELFFEESAILLDEQDSFSERISFLFDSWMMDSQHIIHFEHLLFHQSITVFSQRVYPFCNYWSCWFAIIFGSLLAFRIFFCRGVYSWESHSDPLLFTESSHFWKKTAIPSASLSPFPPLKQEENYDYSTNLKTRSLFPLY